MVAWFWFVRGGCGVVDGFDVFWLVEGLLGQRTAGGYGNHANHEKGERELVHLRNRKKEIVYFGDTKITKVQVHTTNN